MQCRETRRRVRLAVTVDSNMVGLLVVLDRPIDALNAAGIEYLLMGGIASFVPR